MRCLMYLRQRSAAVRSIGSSNGAGAGVCVWRGKVALAGSLLLFLGLTAPWFVYVYVLYRDHAVQTVIGETIFRLLGPLSPVPLIALPVITFPWSFVCMHLLMRAKSFPSDLFRMGSRGLLGPWVGLGVLPFFFIGFFSRYLIWIFL